MTSTVGQQMARKMERTQQELLRARRTAIVKGATELKQGVERRLPASKRLRGVGKKGARIGVRYDIQGETSAVVKAIGPLHLLERDTKAHVIRPKKFTGTRGTGKRAQKGAALMAAFGLNANDGGAIRLADGQLRGVVQHPGTKGQHPFEKGIDASRDKALKAMANPISDAVKRGLRS